MVKRPDRITVNLCLVATDFSNGTKEISVTLQSELLRIALALRKESPYFNSGWNINFLQAFIRDGGNCVYCGRDVLSEFCVACGDHLLPKNLYPTFAQNVDNLVPACTHCNRMKSDYDPSEGKGMNIVLTKNVRLRFVERSKQEINRRKAEYERDFLTGRDAFARAVAQYHRTLG